MTKIKTPLSFKAIALTAMTLTACSEYQVTLNETVIRTPKTLFTDFQTTDKHLQTCLDQAIKDQKVTEPGQLTLLNCSHAGIKTLEGLEVFRNLKLVNLGHNELAEITSLGKMGRIETLLLNDNLLVNVSELLTLPQIQELNLENNPNLQCEDLAQIEELTLNTFSKPDHCK